MIKRKNGKKKGFSLIELIIVLAVMAIIALIAIPNFTAVRNNSKVKADEQSCETIERAVLMLVSDGTIDNDGSFEFTVVSKTVTLASASQFDTTKEQPSFIEALKEVKTPQAKEATGTRKLSEEEKKVKDLNGYKVEIKDGSVEVITTSVKTE